MESVVISELLYRRLRSEMIADGIDHLIGASHHRCGYHQMLGNIALISENGRYIVQCERRDRVYKLQREK